jgi:uncharacterized protein (TIGR02453 family)
MDAMFQGFNEKTTDFLWDIRFNNERIWFDAHKDAYLEHVWKPLNALAEELHTEFNGRHSDLRLNLHVSRIYRDARRLHGRGPYKDNLWFSLRANAEDWTGLPVFWFEIKPEGYGYGLGVYSAKPNAMARFRKEIDENQKEILRLAKALKAQSVFQIAGDEYAKPKGNPPAPLNEWYNRRTLDLVCERGNETALYSRTLLNELLSGYEFLLPYYSVFDRICRE